MKCGFCAYEFDEKAAGKACEGCIMAFSCGLVKCPNCGFENAPDPDWIKNRREKNVNGKS